MDENDLKKFKQIATIVVSIVVFFILLALKPWVVVPAGNRGVIMKWGQVQNEVFGEGLHFFVPVQTSIKLLSTRTQATAFDEKGADSAGTQDSQQVDINVTINWHLDPSKVNKIYQTIGDNDAVISNVLTNNVKQSVKQSISKYVALDVQKNRDQVAVGALVELQKRVEPYHVIVENLSITNINFSEEFNKSIEEAQIQQQKAKAAEYAVVTAQNTAKSAIAAAEGQAQAQKLLQQALTPELLQKMAIDKWSGQFPTYFGGGVLPFLNLK